MNQNTEVISPLVVIFIIPIVLLLIICVGFFGGRRSRIETLREKVKSLPLDEKIIERRLEIFDKICARVGDYDTKISLLEKLASGEKVNIRKKRRSSWKMGEPYSWQGYYKWQERSERGIPISGVYSKIITGHY